MEMGTEYYPRNEFKCIFDINPENKSLHFAVDDNQKIQKQIDQGKPQLCDNN